MPGKAPAHLGESARHAWVEIVSAIGLTPDGIEGPAVEAYAVAVGRMRDAQQRIDSEGMIVADDKGRPTPHPALAIERGASADVKRWAERYRRRPR